MKKKKYLFAVVFVLPAFLVYTIFIVAPVFFSICYSFTSWDGIGTPKMNGIQNKAGGSFRIYPDSHSDDPVVPVVAKNKGI